MAFPAPNGTDSLGNPVYPLGKLPGPQIEGATSTPQATPGTTTGPDSGLLSVPPSLTPASNNLGQVTNPTANIDLVGQNFNGTVPLAPVTFTSPLLNVSNTLPETQNFLNNTVTNNPVDNFLGPPATYQSFAPTQENQIAINNLTLPNSTFAPNAIDSFLNPAPTPVFTPTTTAPSYRGTPVSTNTTNIPDNEIVGQIPYFLQSVLSTPAGALPKGPLWVVTFDNSYDADAKAYIGKSGIPSIINSVADYEPQAPKWNVTKAIRTICSDNFLQTKGCILAQNVTVPGEGIIATGVEGIQSNSFIRSKVGQGRNDFEDLRIGFLNTNVSFVDNVIRPWVIMTGHKGLIARKGADQYRTNISVHRLGISNHGEPPFILQTFNFYGVCPTQVDSEEYTYNDNGTAVVRTATFTYQWYTVDSSKNKFTI